MPGMKNIVILISGGGSNMASIVEAAKRDNWPETLGVRIAAVISNRPDAKGITWAENNGIDTAIVDHKLHATRETFEQELSSTIQPYQPSLIVLAGFMRILTASFINQYRGKILNIHPSLLPAFTGLHTHQRAIDAGCKFAGATVHEVIPELDAGPIVDQIAVPVLPDDTAQSLASRILTQEHVLYPRAIARFLRSS